MTRLVTTVARSWLSLALAGAGLGCAGDPDILREDALIADGELALVTPLEAHVERVVWERGAPGCEGIAMPGDKLASCEGEPSLAALLDAEGRVRCVDARVLLAFETAVETADPPALEWPVEAIPLETGSLGPRAGDPSPQPNRPPPPGAQSTGMQADGSTPR